MQILMNKYNLRIALFSCSTSELKFLQHDYLPLKTDELTITNNEQEVKIKGKPEQLYLVLRDIAMNFDIEHI